MSTLRHRELVLSLKYSTIEACFSVPMLNLTMPNLPFLLAYATASLHWPAWAIGLIAALPHICNGMQPPISRALERRWSLHRIMQWGFALSAIPWFFVVFTSRLSSPSADLLFAFLLGTATLANSITSVAWSASISQVVPEHISGTYFGRRNLMFGAWTLMTVLLAGKIVDLTGRNIFVFAGIFAAAGMARLIGLVFLRKMKFPASVTERQAVGFKFSDSLIPMMDRNYRTYTLFVGFWGMFLNMGLPFYTVFLIRHLRFSVGQTIVLYTLATLGGILTLRSWGTLSDRFGSKPVQTVCCYVWVLIGLLGWSIANPGWHLHLYLVFLLVGGATAGFQLAQFNLMLKLTPSGMGSLYIAVFLAATSTMAALGPLLGSITLAFMPLEMGNFLGHPFTHYHLLFLVSFLGCLLSLPILTSAREPSSKDIHHVWRSMWRMRSFNPLFALSTTAGLFLTPRGMLSLAYYSIRTVRRQLRRVVDVGTELLSGSQK